MTAISMLINGERVQATGGATFERRNPLDHTVATTAPAATVADAVAAIEARPPFAVAVNTTFVPNTRYAAHALQPGDRVEIISPVTGG